MRVVEIRRLGPGDEVLLVQFDLDEPRRPPLAPDAAGRFLADPRTHLWVALDGGEPVGMPLAYELPRRRGATTIVHVYEIGVALTVAVVSLLPAGRRAVVHVPVPAPASA